MKVKLGDLCENSQEKFNIEASQLIDYIDIASVDNVTKTIVGYNTFVCCEAPSRARKLVRQNDIIISTVRPNLNSVALVNVETPNTLVVSTGFCVLRPKANVCPNYIFHFCKSKKFIDSLTKQATGASYPAVSDRIIKEEIIPSFSYEEQIAIAGTLDRVSHLLSLRHQQLEKLDLLVKSQFVEMFGNPLDTAIANRYFVECVEFNPKKSEIKDLMDEIVSFVPMECVGVDGSFTIKEDGLVKNYYKGYTYFRNGDVLLAKITPCFENGKVAIAENCTNGIGFGTTEFHVSRPIDGISNSQWIKHLLKNDFIHDFAAINMTGSAGQKRIQTPFFEKLRIYLPPIEEQNQFAAFVQQVDKSKFVIKQSIEKLELLNSKLMQDYFG